MGSQVERQRHDNRYCIVMWVSIHPWDVSLGGLGAGHIARRDSLSTPGAGLTS